MSKKVFIIDDDPAFIELMIDYLVNDGYDTNGTADLLDLILLDAIDLPDVFLLNIEMWGEDCDTICRYLKGNLSTGAIPLILFSKGKWFEQESGSLYADDFISIPFEIKFLSGLLKKVTSS